MGQHTHLYKLKAWKDVLRPRQLAKEPFCRFCLQLGYEVIATVADHITPHRGDPDLFFTEELQSLCETCHNGVKQREELNGYNDMVGADGWPIDPRHPSNSPDDAASREGGVETGARRQGIGVGSHARVTAELETKNAFRKSSKNQASRPGDPENIGAIAARNNTKGIK